MGFLGQEPLRRGLAGLAVLAGLAGLAGLLAGPGPAGWLAWLAWLAWLRGWLAWAWAGWPGPACPSLQLRLSLISAMGSQKRRNGVQNGQKGSRMALLQIGLSTLER